MLRASELNGNRHVDTVWYNMNGRSSRTFGNADLNGRETATDIIYGLDVGKLHGSACMVICFGGRVLRVLRRVTKKKCGDVIIGTGHYTVVYMIIAVNRQGPNTAVYLIPCSDVLEAVSSRMRQRMKQKTRSRGVGEDEAEKPRTRRSSNVVQNSKTVCMKYE